MTTDVLNGASRAAPGSARLGGDNTACVLDDDPEVGKFVCEILASSGIGAQQYTETKSFLTNVKVRKPGLIVLDLSLGESDAVEVIRQLEALRYTGNVLLMSGKSAETIAAVERIGQSHGLFMLPALCKPFRASELKERIKMNAAPAAASPKLVRSIGAAVPFDLNQALRKRWLELWYQPKIDLKTLKVCGAEGLLQARHPERGILSAAEILPPAGHPLYEAVSAFLVKTALSDWEHVFQQKASFKLAINAPISVLQSRDFIRFVRESMPKSPDFPGLMVEIAQDEVVHDAQSLREIAAQLKLYNIELSIDDFGSAYSSLSRLRDVPFSELKLARSFVTGCAADQSKLALCRSVVDLAHGMGASACAEGIETQDDLRTVLKLGFDTGQGSLFAKAQPAKQLASFLLGRGPDNTAKAPPGRSTGPP